MSRSSLTVLCILGLAVAGCDRAAEEPVQESAVGEAVVAGEVDRSHAGEMIPAANLSNPAGKVLNLGAAEGTAVLLNLWATWCAPCVKEMPQLDQLAARDQGLAVIAASQDVRGAEAVEPFFARTGLQHLEPWLDPQNLLMEALGAETLPVTVLYDADGREVWRITGAYDWTSTEAAALIAEGYADLPGSGEVER